MKTGLQFKDDEWISILADPARRVALGLPELAPDSMQAKYTGRSGRLTFEQAVGFWNVALRQAKAWRRFGPDSSLLDIGCGWGRMSATAMRDFAPERITSIDVQTESVDFCRRAGFVNVVKCEAGAPLPLPDSSFDMAIAYSVFSHLNEETHWALLKEIRRVLKPGGVAVVTTRGRSIFTVLRNDRAKGDRNPAFPDTEDAERRYDAGEFMFDGPHVGSELAGFYGEAAIPRQYAEREWPKLFQRVVFIPPEKAGQEQPAIAVMKHGRLAAMLSRNGAS